MIRIGPSRWFVTLDKSRQRDRRTYYKLGMVPQAKEYVVLAKDREGRMTGRTVHPLSCQIMMSEDTYDASFGKNEANICSRLAEELSIGAVGECEKLSILQGHCRSETIYIVKVGLIQHMQRPEEVMEQQINSIDLMQDQMDALEAAARHEMDLEIAHLADVEMRQALSGKALVASMKLLYEYLTEDEQKEARQHGRVTVKTSLGDFVVPVLKHGLVRQYVNGEYMQSYCVAPADRDIPAGDEALQKIIYLKKAPGKLFEIANKFKERLVPSGVSRHRM